MVKVVWLCVCASTRKNGKTQQNVRYSRKTPNKVRVSKYQEQQTRSLCWVEIEYVKTELSFRWHAFQMVCYSMPSEEFKKTRLRCQLQNKRRSFYSLIIIDEISYLFQNVSNPTRNKINDIEFCSMCVLKMFLAVFSINCWENLQK